MDVHSAALLAGALGVAAWLVAVVLAWRRAHRAAVDRDGGSRSGEGRIRVGRSRVAREGRTLRAYHLPLPPASEATPRAEALAGGLVRLRLSPRGSPGARALRRDVDAARVDALGLLGRRARIAAAASTSLVLASDLAPGSAPPLDGLAAPLPAPDAATTSLVAWGLRL